MSHFPAAHKPCHYTTCYLYSTVEIAETQKERAHPFTVHDCWTLLHHAQHKSRKHPTSINLLPNGGIFM